MNISYKAIYRHFEYGQDITTMDKTLPQCLRNHHNRQDTTTMFKIPPQWTIYHNNV